MNLKLKTYPTASIGELAKCYFAPEILKRKQPVEDSVVIVRIELVVPRNTPCLSAVVLQETQTLTVNVILLLFVQKG
jgi:hypothetical protein